MLKMVLFSSHKSELDYQSSRDLTLDSHSDFKSLPSASDDLTFGLATQFYNCVSTVSGPLERPSRTTNPSLIVLFLILVVLYRLSAGLPPRINLDLGFTNWEEVDYFYRRLIESLKCVVGSKDYCLS